MYCYGHVALSGWELRWERANTYTGHGISERTKGEESERRSVWSPLVQNRFERAGAFKAAPTTTEKGTLCWKNWRLHGVLFARLICFAAGYLLMLIYGRARNYLIAWSSVCRMTFTGNKERFFDSVLILDLSAQFIAKRKNEFLELTKRWTFNIVFPSLSL